MDTGQHTSDLGQWQTLQRPADARLRAYVHGYFASSSALRVPVLERHLPSVEVPLLINFGEPHRRLDRRSGDAGDTATEGEWTAHDTEWTARDSEWTSRDGAWIVGLHTRHQLTHAIGERHFMVVRFTPLGAHRFLGVPMDAIANDAIDLGQIDVALARSIADRVGLARGWPERFDAAEALIGERIAGSHRRSSVCIAGDRRRLHRDALLDCVDHVWQKLVSSDGRIALGSLAGELNCSHRTLIAGFRTNLGFAPKTMARLLRFNHVVRWIDRTSGTRANALVGKPYIEADEVRSDRGRPDVTASREEASTTDRRPRTIRWADIAADCGYFDQAHLIKDFREFAGHTPDAFLRRVSDVV